MIRLHGKSICILSCRPGSLLQRAVFGRRISASRQRADSSFHTTTVATSDKKKVVVALSGGVDSAVVVGILLKQHQLADTYTIAQAVHMTNWNAHDDDSITFCMEQDWKDATATAHHFGLGIRRQSFEQEYWHEVFVPYLDALSRKGWMGNPDVACNVHIKFGVFLDFVKDRYGADTWLATGHYARLWRRRELEVWIDKMYCRSNEDLEWLLTWGRSESGQNGTPAADEDLPLLVSALDESKDQSYFLSGCTSQQLSRVLFPLGDYHKNHSGTRQASSPTVRQLAKDWDIPVAQKRDSSGICFIGKRRGGFRSFLEHYYEPTPSSKRHNVVDVETSRVLCTVDALTAQAATIGQGAKIHSLQEKYFVAGKTQDEEATILVCPGTHHPALYSDSIELASDFSWTMPEIPRPLHQTGELRVQCRVRHLQPLVDATLRYNTTTERYEIFTDRPLRAVTPGQRAVLYLDGICLGGATILRPSESYFHQGKPLPNDLHPAGANDLSVLSRNQHAS